MACTKVDALILKVLLAKIEGLPVEMLRAFCVALGAEQSFKSVMWEADIFNGRDYIVLSIPGSNEEFTVCQIPKSIENDAYY